MRFKLLLLLLTFLNVKCFKSYDIKALPLLSRAFKDISRSLLDKNRKVSIINYDSDASVVGFIALGSSQQIPVKMETSGKYDLTDSAILTFNSLNSLIMFNQQVKLTNMFPKSHQFIVHCESSTRREISEIKEVQSPLLRTSVTELGPYDLENLFKSTEILHFQYFLVEEEDIFLYLTFVWYTRDHCNVPQLIEVNRFFKKTRQWKFTTFKIEKFHNFHGCTLVFGVMSQELAFETRLHDDGSYEFKGFNHEIITGLSKNLNFSFVFNPFNQGFVYPHKLDLILLIGCLNLNEAMRKETYISKPYVFYYNYMAVPPGAEFNAYEKLLLPFDPYVWALISITFAIAFSVILMVNVMNETIRNFVFGEGVTTPSLNVVILFFGLSQTILPVKNFARFIVMMFIFYCLIMRTAWQGKMFEFMNKDIRKTTIQSVDELISKNFSCYMFKQFSFFFKGSDIVER